jgi:NAD(P)-dependent dehydrogenase (short-subunit alcohol dehydrogenase family)
MSSKKPVCAVVGVGPGNGAAFARRFAREGFAVALLARSTETSGALAKELPDSRAYACDVADEASIESAFAALQRDLGAPSVVVYNAGGSANWSSIEEASAKDFETAWRINALGAFHVSKHVIPAMKAAGAGNIIFIGATASRRGVPRTTTFAPAKAAQRSLAEAMARHLWPLGIHVSLVIIDGVVDLPRTRAMMKDKPGEFFVKPDDVADTAFQITKQPRSTWAFEVEARPFAERW